MNFKRLPAFILLLFISATIEAQISFTDTVKEYNKQRIIINLKGSEALGIWGIANIVVGGVGAPIAKDDEWKYFHGTNAAFGALNTGVAAYMLLRCKKQSREKASGSKAYKDYRSDRKALLVNMGLDAAYMGAGALLVQNANTIGGNPAMYRGIGRSLVVQGVFLMAFDNIMFSAQQKYHSRWAQLLDEMRFTGTGLGFVHNF